MTLNDQPLRHRTFLIVIAALTLATSPWAFVGRRVRLVFGIPVWLWSSIIFTVLLAGMTAFGILRWWRDDESD